MKRLTVGNHVVEWVAKRTNEFGNFGCATGIGQLEQYDGIQGKSWRLVAGVAYAEWNGVNVVCHIAAEGKRWMSREFLWTMFDYPFNQLGCTRLTACVGEGNLPSRKFVEHLGFTLEARLEKAHPSGDILIYKLGKPDARWLNLHKGTEHEKLAA